MKKKIVTLAGLVALSFGTLFGCSKDEKKIDLKPYFSWQEEKLNHIKGKIGNVNIEYESRKAYTYSQIYLSLDDKKITIFDGRIGTEYKDGKVCYNNLDGKINCLMISKAENPEILIVCYDDGSLDYKYLENAKNNGWPNTLDTLSEEKIKELIKWGNKTLGRVHQIAKKEFGDKLIIPYNLEKPEEFSIDAFLKDFEF